MYSVFELVSEDILEAVGAAPNLKPPKSARAGPCGDETARDAVWCVWAPFVRFFALGQSLVT